MNFPRVEQDLIKRQGHTHTACIADGRRRWKGYAIIPSTATRRHRVAQQASPGSAAGFCLF